MYEATMMMRISAVAIISKTSSYFAEIETPRYGR
ncbi:Uncharacterised protein [Mycobacteroides abscessus subsp. abscessus]|nr:Uncharacterised protein [Mycobacteroides abscessus subsp. abscessus]